MELNFDFVVDRCVRDKIYPALARWRAEPYTPEWRQFDHHWPYTVPLRIQEYCTSHSTAIRIHELSSSQGKFYPIGLGWFDFEIDYFDLLPASIFHAVNNLALKILFYYHEGDNPERIKSRLDALVQKHRLPQNCYKFVINNSAADDVPGFVFFPDTEIWFWQRNRDVPALPFNTGPRSRDFSALVRLHKDYRMVVMADMVVSGLLDSSYWSYCEADVFQKDQCPIAVDTVPGMSSMIDQFTSLIPHYSDDLTQDQRNDHSGVVPEYFTDSYFHIVLETHFDADQSGGTLLSEKTFKPIKHAQPFFIVGPAGSLQCLRDLGYRTFDSVLNNSYDTIADNTQRWLAVRSAIVKAQQQGLHGLAQACRADCEHNQQLFLSSKQPRLSKLIQQLYA